MAFFSHEDQRIWIDQRGRVHDAPQTHGARVLALLSEHDSAEGIDLWSMNTFGSTPPLPDTAEWELEDNPGWQYSNFAITERGWLRWTYEKLGLRVEVGIEFIDAKVGKPALGAAIRLLAPIAREFGEARVTIQDIPVSPEQAIAWLRELADEK
jgi:hypothetical protein